MKKIIIVLLFLNQLDVFCGIMETKILDIKPYILNYKQPNIPDSTKKLLDSVAERSKTYFNCTYVIRFKIDSLGNTTRIKIFPSIDIKEEISDLYLVAVDNICNILNTEVKEWKICTNKLFPDGMGWWDKKFMPNITIRYNFEYQSKNYGDFSKAYETGIWSYIWEEILIVPK